jgi:hypothetical protein
MEGKQMILRGNLLRPALLLIFMAGFSLVYLYVLRLITQMAYPTGDW